MRTDIHIGIFDLFIFLGIFQGLILSWFFIKNSKGGKLANLYQGLLLLSLSFGIFEELLNNTGFIVQVLPITNYGEPLNFTYAPLLYLYVTSILYPNKKRKVWWHFIFSVFWLFYLYFQFIQPDAAKYNEYVNTKHPDWESLKVVYYISADPLGIRQYCNELSSLSFIVYISVVIGLIIRKSKALKESLLKTNNGQLILVRNTAFHFFMIIIVFLATKMYFGIGSDIGGYLIAAYISFMIFATSFQILNRSDFFNQPQSFLNFPAIKYQKSSLLDKDKESILSKIKNEMENKSYYTNNLCSLAGLAKNIKESTHHVSQVINEKMDKSFFELLAWYRVEEAKKLIINDTDSKLTVEELAEQVGYNSKSSFNNAFKKLTSQTPTEFRKFNNNS